MLINLIMWEKEAGLKAKHVAERLGITPTKYSLIKNGKQEATVGLVIKFEEEFGETVPDENVLRLFKTN